MASSDDDEKELSPGAVTDYHFVDEKEEPICFSILPVQWCEGGSLDAPRGQVFLHGKIDNGLRKIYKQVVAWKVKMGAVPPEVWVLSKEKRWLKLLKPRKAYAVVIRKILITLQCLFYLKRNPMSSVKSLWVHVRRIFSQFEVRASEHDLLDHLTFIQAVVERDKILSKSQLLLKYLNELSQKKASSETLKRRLHADLKFQKLDFINVDDDVDHYDEGASDDDEGDCFDTVCALCDNGGEVLCCEGKCLRSFHAIKGTGVDSHCKTLGYMREQVHDMPSFLCLNCLYAKHQCFACGKLGNSDKKSGAEVYRCINATCGHFYHPDCAARLIHPDNEAQAIELAEKITSGESFTCSIHKCIVCKEVENKKKRELQFAVCRRCPRSYHRKCLPRRISFEHVEEEGIIQRAWDDLIPNRILIYCLKHKIDKTISTPIRNHIVFPGTSEKKIAYHPDSSKGKIPVKRKAEEVSKGKISKELTRVAEIVPSSVGKSNKALFGPVIDSFKKMQPSDIPKHILKDRVNKGPIIDERKVSMRDEGRASSMPSNELQPCKSLSRGVLRGEVATAVPSGKKLCISSPLIDDEIKKRILLLVKGSPSSLLTVEDLLKEKHVPTTHAYDAIPIGKTITLGKVEGSIQNKLKVYLAPFIHGVRYTSYGRHFTQVNKLREIVDRLHWYVQSGDTIVDFGCGANDFSILMRKKLEETGKECSFKNYDLIQPKNDFGFENRDWMTVEPHELPTGSQLIMGLNPPFGVKAALANKFIDKALKFKPKLLILIVPKETERLDAKRAAYDLIWEDEQMLSGKSFYLPGSVDVDHNQMEQWNVKPPLLYLWSRPDWTAKHKAIAAKCGHISSVREKCNWGVGKECVGPGRLPEFHGYPGIQSEVPNYMLNVKDWAEGCLETIGASYRQGDCEILENVADRNYRDDGARRAIERKHTESCELKQSNEPEEELMGRTASNLSDMDISPPHQTGHQHLFGDHLTFEGHMDRMTAMGSFQRPAPRLEMAYGGDPSTDLLAEDAGHVEQRCATSGGKDLLSTLHDWSTYGGGNNLSYDIHGSSEQLTWQDGGGPIHHLDRAPVGGERASRADAHTLIKMYGQHRPCDSPSSMFTSGAQAGLSSLPSFGISSSALGSSTMPMHNPCTDEQNYVEQGPSVFAGPTLPGDVSASRSRPRAGSQNPFPGHGSCGWLDE